MKRILLPILSLACALSLLAGCEIRPPEGAEEESSQVSEGSEAAAPSKPVTYTVEEAAANNAGISAADVNLLQLEEPKIGSELAVIKTNMGELTLYLYPEQAPKAVENFTTHAKAGYYNGLTFDKIMNNFIVEGGDPDGEGGESVFKDADGKAVNFEVESSLSLWHFRGAVSMSQTEFRDGNGSRFFIVQAPFVDEDTVAAMKEAKFPDKVIAAYEEMGGTPGFDGKRSVFGMLDAESLKALDAIALVEAEDDGTPMETVLIESVEIRTLTAEPDTDGSGAEEESSQE